jgi:anti-anti-sigma factor
MAHQLGIDTIRRGSELTLSGRLDARSADLARTVLADAVDSGVGDLVLHVGELELWDARGVGVLVVTHRRARQAGRRLVLADVPPRQLRLLRATRLSRLLTVEPLAAA